MRIFLIGFMGAGKSHTGRKLAELLGHPFIDLDNYIEEQAGQSITEIFKNQGERGFRELESECLKSLVIQENAVIATGGGTSCFFDNSPWMNNHGITIYLKTPPELLATRLENQRAHRPLIAKLSDKELLGFIKKKLKEREGYYKEAIFTIPQNEEGVDIAAKLAKTFG